MQDLQKQFSDNVLNSYIEQYKEELKIFESKHEQVSWQISITVVANVDSSYAPL